MAIHVVTEENFEAEVLNSSMPVLVDFYATWCGPCKLMMPKIDMLSESEEFAGKVKVVKIDVEENQELVGSNKIQSMPTFIAFKNGVETGRVTGSCRLDQLKELFK